MNTNSFAAALIAPCGMNCGVCAAYVRKKNRCPGCNGPDVGKPKTRVLCKIKNCDKRTSGNRPHCGSCDTYPCAPLRKLDKRYRTKYGMSMIENLNAIRTDGLDALVKRESLKWVCARCGSVLCVHRSACLTCGKANRYFPGIGADRTREDKRDRRC